MFSGRYTYRPPKRPEDHLGSCENVIFIRNAGTNPKVMAVRSKANVNRKNLIMSLADSCFEFLRDLEKEHDPEFVRRRAAEFAEDRALLQSTNLS